MSTLKKFIKYFIIFLIVYALVSLFSFHTIQMTYKTKPVEIDFDSPKVEIIESKATITNGYVKGKITNNTNEEIIDKFLKLELLNPKNEKIGNKFINFGNLQPNETKEFISKFNHDNVGKIKCSLADKSEVDEWSDFSLDDLNVNKTHLKYILFATFVFFGEDLIMALPFL